MKDQLKYIKQIDAMIDGLDQAAGTKRAFRIRDEFFGMSMEPIAETRDNVDDDEGGPLLDWISAELAGDDSAAELATRPEVRRYHLR